MEYTADRTEGGIIILIGADGEKLEVEAAALNFSVQEGDILDFDGEFYSLNKEKTAARKSALEARFKKLLKKKNTPPS